MALQDLLCQLNWTTLPGLHGLACSEFRATETDAPDNERGVAIAFRTADERDALLREMETYFAGQRFSNNAAAFSTLR